MAVVTVFGQRCAESLAHSPQHRASIEEERGSKEREEMGVRGGGVGGDDNNS